MGMRIFSIVVSLVLFLSTLGITIAAWLVPVIRAVLGVNAVIGGTVITVILMMFLVWDIAKDAKEIRLT